MQLQFVISHNVKYIYWNLFSTLVTWSLNCIIILNTVMRTVHCLSSQLYTVKSLGVTALYAVLLAVESVLGNRWMNEKPNMLTDQLRVWNINFINVNNFSTYLLYNIVFTRSSFSRHKEETRNNRKFGESFVLNDCAKKKNKNIYWYIWCFTALIDNNGNKQLQRSFVLLSTLKTQREAGKKQGPSCYCINCLYKD